MSDDQREQLDTPEPENCGCEDGACDCIGGTATWDESKWDESRWG
jgi:hypothetical protein